MSRVLMVVTIFSFVWGNLCYAQDTNQDQSTDLISGDESLGLIHFIEIHVDDQVSGGCWTNVNQIRKNVRLKLEQSGIETAKKLLWEGPYGATLIIDVIGYRTEKTNVCVGYLNVSLVNYRAESFGYYGEYEIYRRYLLYQKAGIMTSGDNLNTMIKKDVDGYVSELAAKIIRNRGNEPIKKILKSYPIEANKPKIAE